MISLTMRCKSIFLVGAMVFSTATTFTNPTETKVPAITGSGFGFAALCPTKETVAIATFVWAWATWVRLNTKGSAFDYTTENWREDFKAFLQSLNIFDAESRATLMNLYDKWIVGRAFSLIDVAYRSRDENGVVVTRKDKKVKSKPFGLMGLFDAYVLIQLKKTQEVLVPAAFMWAVTNDPFGHFAKALVDAQKGQTAKSAA